MGFAVVTEVGFMVVVGVGVGVVLGEVGVGVGVGVGVVTGGVTRTVVVAVAVVGVGAGWVGVGEGVVLFLSPPAVTNAVVDEVFEVADEVDDDVFETANVEDVDNIDANRIDEDDDIEDDAASDDIANDISDDVTDDVAGDAGDGVGDAIADWVLLEECLLCTTPTAAPIATPMSNTTSKPIKIIQKTLLRSPNMVGGSTALCFDSALQLLGSFTMTGPDMASRPGYSCRGSRAPTSRPSAGGCTSNGESSSPTNVSFSKSSGLGGTPPPRPAYPFSTQSQHTMVLFPSECGHGIPLFGSPVV